MPHYKTIIACTDFSANARAAVREAVYVADHTGAHLYVVHVVAAARRFAHVGPPAEEEAPVSGMSAVADAIRQGQAVLKVQQSLPDVPDVGIEAVVRRGEAAPEILEFAEEVGAGLLIVGWRGVGALSGLFGRGSVTDELVRTGSLPVLIVPS
jgi:nucleotide-binding universal stress UspA family protein